MKDFTKEFRSFFNGFEIAGYLLIIIVITTGYLYFLTNHMQLSIAVGVISSFFTLYHSVYLPRCTYREQYLLEELQKYSSTMTFYLQAGHNVLKSLELSKSNLDKEIQKDIQLTIDKLNRGAVLDTSHFKRYNFPSINIFHQILDIKYQVGGSASELFLQVNQNVNFEIVKRDELYRRKNYIRQKIFMMMAVTLTIPLLLAFLSKDLYAQFLTGGTLSLILVIGLFTLTSISLFFVQKNATDISIYD